MKTKNLIIILAVLGIIALVGGYMMGLFSNSSVITEEADNLPENTEPVSETVDDKETTEDVLEKEEVYADEEGPVSSDSPELLIEEGLVAYYPFNEDTKDYSGEKKDATNYGAVFTEGKSGKALKFDGKNSFVHAPININPMVIPQMTMAAWVKENEGSKIMHVISSDDAGYDRAMGTDNRGPGQEGWACFAGDGRILGSHPIQASKWTFIAAIYDQTAGTVKLFVDGSTYEKDAKTAKGNDFILIGARGTTEKQGEYFKGAVDEVRIYDYALSDTELNSLYKTGAAKPKASN